MGDGNSRGGILIQIRYFAKASHLRMKLLPLVLSVHKTSNMLR